MRDVEAVLLEACRAHLRRLQDEVEARLRDPAALSAAQHAHAERARKRADWERSRSIGRFRSEVRPRVVEWGVSEEELAEWYRTALIAGVMES